MPINRPHGRGPEATLHEPRKLAILLAIVGQPGLVVLDEPTTGLDPVARTAIWEIVRQSASQATLATTCLPCDLSEVGVMA